MISIECKITLFFFTYTIFFKKNRLKMILIIEEIENNKHCLFCKIFLSKKSK